MMHLTRTNVYGEALPCRCAVIAAQALMDDLQRRNLSDHPAVARYLDRVRDGARMALLMRTEARHQEYCTASRRARVAARMVAAAIERRQAA